MLSHSSNWEVYYGLADHLSEWGKHPVFLGNVPEKESGELLFIQTDNSLLKCVLNKTGQVIYLEFTHNIGSMSINRL